ncbi:hypothetical protein [Crateriforma conspicua]|uniref:hypothetical protein n=1 Tax=Crateriforma conspicua TaxID=2527996 RepID=UPI00118B0996|nr:hypothetical protein [Crateriforma conspicua]QDV62499.1 hypothetical protein Mal65_16330 [Crateriforma conspicua]
MELIHKSSLSLQRQLLVETLQRVNFGRLEHIRFRSGQPELHDDSKIVREHKFSAENGPRPESDKSDFTLKRPLVELFQYFDQRVDGEIDVLEVKHGLPFRMIVIEPAA